MILFFSGCGNSEFVALQLAELLGDKAEQIDPQGGDVFKTLAADEPLGLVCPVYAWAVPRLVTDYLRRLTLSAKPSYCYLACTCGDSVGKTPERLAKFMESKGWRLNAAFGFVMPETYINLPGFKLDTPENAQKKVDSVRERLADVAKRIERREECVDVVRGKMAWVNTYVTNALFYKLLITDRKFRVTDDCVSCGKCMEVCQLKNVTLDSGKPVWHGNCTNCMSCYHRCPTNAIRFGKATDGKGQYYFGKEL